MPIQRARDAESLPLPAAELDTALTDPLLVTRRQPPDQIVQLRKPSRLPQALLVDVCNGNPERDVLRDACIKQKDILWHVGDPRLPGRAIGGI